jgi:hypothetical protein
MIFQGKDISVPNKTNIAILAFCTLVWGHYSILLVTPTVS